MMTPELEAVREARAQQNAATVALADAMVDAVRAGHSLREIASAADQSHETARRIATEGGLIYDEDARAWVPMVPAQ